MAIIKDPSLNNLNTIQHGFFTREGGVSTGRYASLNCALASPDSLENILENRKRVTSYFGFPLETLVTVKKYS